MTAGHHGGIGGMGNQILGTIIPPFIYQSIVPYLVRKYGISYVPYSQVWYSTDGRRTHTVAFVCNLWGNVFQKRFSTATRTVPGTYLNQIFAA
jgi:hypothetical protein